MAFNWNIIKAPHAIADYVVVHELCHLIHLNHFWQFWQLVS
jgi:predicted metal-dependent hydrolase